MEEYKSNSHKVRNGEIQDNDEKKEIQKVTRGKVSVRKESLGSKMADTFLTDNVGNVKNYIFFDVLVPAIKDTIADMINNTVNMMFYNTPGGRHTNRNGIKAGGSRVSYSGYYDDRERRSKPEPRRERRGGLSEVIFETRADAKEALDSMHDILQRYKILSVAEYYELAGVEEIETYTDRDFGWYPGDLDNVQPIRDRDGFKLTMPRPTPLD